MPQKRFLWSTAHKKVKHRDNDQRPRDQEPDRKPDRKTDKKPDRKSDQKKDQNPKLKLRHRQGQQVQQEQIDLGSFDLRKDKDPDPGELSMSVSPICHTESGEKYAYVSFTDGKRSAEGRIPDCRIDKNDGFAAIEIAQLEAYMRDNLRQLKTMAAGVNPLKALMK